MGIVSYGSYVPRYRLDRGAVRTVLGVGGGRGTRSVAGYDEDTTSLAVEAARRALWAAEQAAPATLAFATSRPGYLDKTNATAIHAALALPPATDAVDCVGAPRSGHAAVDLAAARGGLAVMADIRWGRPTSAEELEGGDAGVAVLFAEAGCIADEIGRGVATAEFMDRWRLPHESFVSSWEERFGEHAYTPLVAAAVADALANAGVTVDALDHVIVTGLHTRAARAAARALGVGSDRLVDDLGAQVGNSGTAHPWLLLTRALDIAEPGATIALVHLADGCVARVFRTTDRLADVRRRVERCRDRGTLDVSYGDALTWRGLLEREAPRRPRPDVPAAPPSRRTAAWKFGFAGSVDEAGNVHIPPTRTSRRTGSLDAMEPVRLADRKGTIVNFTVDRLAYSLSPPVIVAIVDFDAGGRYQCELTDSRPDHVKIGQRVAMTFRKLYTADGVHDYFWKARPIADDPATGRAERATDEGVERR